MGGSSTRQPTERE